MIDVSLRSLPGQSSVCMLMTRRTACCTQGMYTFFRDEIRIHHILQTRSRPLLKFLSFFFPDTGLIMPDVVLLFIAAVSWPVVLLVCLFRFFEKLPCVFLSVNLSALLTVYLDIPRRSSSHQNFDDFQKAELHFLTHFDTLCVAQHNTRMHLDTILATCISHTLDSTQQLKLPVKENNPNIPD